MIPPAVRHAVLLVLMTQSLALADDRPWIPLFNGRDLDGWTIKITGHPLGVNAHNTFRVEDGILKVSYDGYDKFNG